MKKALIVINPNSTQSLTDGIAAALEPLHSFGIPIRCLTLAEGPPGIETQQQADLTIAPMLARAKREEPNALGYVIACFSDPGLYALRDGTALPVLGIQEAAMMTAMTLGQAVGVIAIKPASITRHMRAFGAMGVSGRIAGERALGLSVTALTGDGTLDAMIATGRALRDEDGAEVLIMGCAGMARYRDPLEQALGIPVVEPCQAAASMALGRIALNQSHKITGATDA
ncbi:aspartate/glutamate racemase family protein [Yoonia sp. 208BN28-4]|uniref:aspartate/glutamate racemase family protein n=1 Tax=Yoonia sp. 208BN28-4 TaxID=3126505 RepID=UPI0030A2326D